jgi:CBS domain-containing protein
MSVGRICTRVVATASALETIRTAAERMEAHNVGTVVVVGSEGSPQGILTDRDIALRCVAKGRDPDDTRVGDLMTRPVRFVHLASPIESALEAMKKGSVRRLAVVDDDGMLVGIVTLDDVLDLVMEEVETIGAIVRRESPVGL